MPSARASRHAAIASSPSSRSHRRACSRAAAVSARGGGVAAWPRTGAGNVVSAASAARRVVAGVENRIVGV